MLSPSLLQQIKCRWREFRREPSAFFWVMFMPIMWMVALGFAFSEPRPETYGVGWEVTIQDTPLFKGTLEASPLVKLRDGLQEELVGRLKRGEVSVIVRWDGTTLVYQYDPKNPEAQRARNFVDQLVQTSAGRQDPITTQDQVVVAEGGRYTDFLIPGLLGLSIMTSSLFGVGMTIVSNRKENLLKRYVVTPMKPYEYIISHIIGRYMVLGFEFCAVMISGMLIFDFQIFGSAWTYLLVALLGAGAFTAIAMLCASRTRSIPTIGALVNLITLPMMMLSGVFFSKNNFPESAQGLLNILPLSALNDALRKVALEGLGIAQIGFELTVLGVYLVLGTILSTKLFKWY